MHLNLLQLDERKLTNVCTFFRKTVPENIIQCSDKHNSKNNKHLMTGPEGNSEFCFPRISMFPSTSSRETLRLEGNKIHCSPRDQSLRDLLYSKTKLKSKI